MMCGLEREGRAGFSNEEVGCHVRFVGWAGRVRRPVGVVARSGRSVWYAGELVWAV